MRLGELKLGERAAVLTVAGVGEISVRLMEMGLTPGVELRLIGIAPLGDPLEFELRGYRLSVRQREADLVEVQRI